jgi:hypothetical protein
MFCQMVSPMLMFLVQESCKTRFLNKIILLNGEYEVGVEDFPTIQVSESHMNTTIYLAFFFFF